MPNKTEKKQPGEKKASSRNGAWKTEYPHAKTNSKLIKGQNMNH